jgi:hypothetical protein
MGESVIQTPVIILCMEDDSIKSYNYNKGVYMTDSPVAILQAADGESCAPPPCTDGCADLDGDGSIIVNDLLALLAACPPPPPSGCLSVLCFFHRKSSLYGSFACSWACRALRNPFRRFSARADGTSADGDLNGDGATDVSDLLVLLGQYGSSCTACASAKMVRLYDIGYMINR